MWASIRGGAIRSGELVEIRLDGRTESGHRVACRYDIDADRWEDPLVRSKFMRLAIREFEVRGVV